MRWIIQVLYLLVVGSQVSLLYYWIFNPIILLFQCTVNYNGWGFLSGMRQAQTKKYL